MGNPRDIIAAIDPGASGGMAWITEGVVSTCSMENRALFIEALRMAEGFSITVYMEKVAGYYPKPKVAAPGERLEFNLQSSAYAMFNFGKAAGILIGICEAFGIELIQVMPAAWQKVCFVKKSGSRGQWKNTLKEIAQRRYPDVKVTLANADALLILSYGILMTRGEIDIAPDKKK